jgi:ParB/RepB/Spo0J family partition protein
MNPWDGGTIESIPADKIYYDMDFNCRDEFTPQSVKELADSITEVGRLMYPLLVQPWKKQGYDYRLIAGFRRYKAITTFLKWPAIPCIVCENLTPHSARLLNITENLARKNLNLWEEARAVHQLYPNGGKLQEIATALKQTTTWVRLRMKLWTMPEAVQRKAAAGLLSQAVLYILSKLPPEEQEKSVMEIAEARLRGTGKRLPGLNREKYRKKLGKVRSRTDMNNLLSRLLYVGCSDFATRAIAWCAGSLTDEEFEPDVKEAILAAQKRKVIGD